MTLAVLEALTRPDERYRFTGAVFLRALGAIYFIAFLSLNRQVLPLFGSGGLLPADLFLERVRSHFGGTGAAFLELPSLFWLHISDAALVAGSWLGLALSALMAFGFANAIAMAFLWFLYMSYVHIGQVFYGYGWETMTLEAGFLAIFLCPAASIRPSFHASIPPLLQFWLRWMLFRVMFGAGLIKLRGDECWRDLTCLVYHYETQPLPNPLSWYLHNMPLWFHKAGVLFNHLVELVAPWFYFGPRRARIAAGSLTIAFQIILIASGNLSWLNWLTIVIAIACFDERAFRFARKPAAPDEGIPRQPIPYTLALLAMSVLLLVLSRHPLMNMISPSQRMNASFDALHIMNTYGAFGSVGTTRREIVIEGSRDGESWLAYEFLAKPGDPARRPAVIAPYQSRIDWQIWFAAMQEPDANPWLIHLIYKLLAGDPAAGALLRSNPFPDGPPRLVRAAYYRYRFAAPEARKNGFWWERDFLGHYLPPLSRDDARLKRYIAAHGWSP